MMSEVCGLWALLSPDSSYYDTCRKLLWKPHVNLSYLMTLDVCGLWAPLNLNSSYSDSVTNPFGNLFKIYHIWWFRRSVVSGLLSLDSSYTDTCRKLLSKLDVNLSYLMVSEVCGLWALLSLDSSYSDTCRKPLWKPYVNPSYLMISEVCGLWALLNLDSSYSDTCRKPVWKPYVNLL